MATISEDRLKALRTVLEEKLVKRGVSLRGVDYGDVQEATQNTVRQVVTIKVGGRELKYKLVDLEEQTGSFSQFLIQSTNVGASKKSKSASPKTTYSTKTDDDEFGNLWDKL